MTFGERYGLWRRSEGVRGLLMVSPTAIYALLLLFVPLVAIVAFSFFTQTGVVDMDYTPTLNNYREAFSDPLYMALMLRSVAISLAVTTATVLLAFPIAYFVSFHVEPSKKSLWLFLITIPLQAINYNAFAVVITLAHAYAPFAILPIFVALEKIDRSLLEAGQDLGETKWTTFLRVTLPLAMPGVVAAVLIVFIPTIGDFVTPRLVGGAGGTMISNMIQTQFLKLNNTPLGASLSVIMMVIVGTISLAFVFVNRRYLGGNR
jgi:spermidine/putrescine transport system permease protein